MNDHQSAISSRAIPENILLAITQALTGLRYGQVTIIVQNGRVMQIDRTDRHRMTSSEINDPATP